MAQGVFHKTDIRRSHLSLASALGCRVSPALLFLLLTLLLPTPGSSPSISFGFLFTRFTVNDTQSCSSPHAVHIFRMSEVGGSTWGRFQVVIMVSDGLRGSQARQGMTKIVALMSRSNYAPCID